MAVRVGVDLGHQRVREKLHQWRCQTIRRERFPTKCGQEVILNNEDLYRLIIENSRDLIRVIDVHFNFVYVSPSHQTLLGYSVEELTSTSGLNLLHPDDREVALALHREMVSNNVSRDGLFRFQCKDGRWITLETRGKSLVQDGKIVGVVTVGRDVTERRRMEQELRVYQAQLQFLAYHDSLTGLPNRSLFLDCTSQALDQARLGRHSLAVVFIDSDDFKKINDVYGHEIGDEVIKELGRRLSQSLRSGDVVARMGGDEFIVLLPTIRAQQDLIPVLSRISQATREGWTIHGQEIGLTVSFGIAIYPADGNDTRTLIRHADEALYKAKQQGKDRFVFYQPDHFGGGGSRGHAR